MANQLFSGFAYDNTGAAVVGATIDLYDRNTTSPSRASTTTGADGSWAISHATEGRFDVAITNGTVVRRRKYDDQVQLDTIEVQRLRILNPAFTFEYDIVAGAILGARQLNLPVTTGTDTFAVLGLAQTFTQRQIWSKGADIASAATITPGTDGNYFNITGTVGVTAIATLAAGAVVIFQFTGALTITHNATTLILASAVNFTTAAGDMMAFVSEGAGNWRELFRRLATTAPTRATQAALEAETSEESYASPDRVRYSPGVAKTWAAIVAAGTLDAGSYRVTSLTDTAVGDRTLNFSGANAQSGSVYAVITGLSATGASRMAAYDTRGTTSVRLTFFQDGVGLEDGAHSVAIFGDL